MTGIQPQCRIPTMNGKRIALSDRIRKAVDACGESRYRICKTIGLDEAVLSKFMAHKCNLSMPTLDRLADALGLDVIARWPVKVAPPRKRGRKPKRKG